MDNPYAEHARQRKAVELEDIALHAGVRASDLADPAVRARLLRVLSEQRGKAVSASTATWDLVGEFLTDRQRPKVAP